MHTSKYLKQNKLIILVYFVYIRINSNITSYIQNRILDFLGIYIIDSSNSIMKFDDKKSISSTPTDLYILSQLVQDSSSLSGRCMQDCKFVLSPSVSWAWKGIYFSFFCKKKKILMQHILYLVDKRTTEEDKRLLTFGLINFLIFYISNV